LTVDSTNAVEIVSVPIPLAIVGNEAAIVLDIRAEFPHASFKTWAARIDVGEVDNTPVEVSQATQGLIYSNLTG
jgi:hypothetical protein